MFGVQIRRQVVGRADANRVAIRGRQEGVRIQAKSEVRLARPVFQVMARR